MALPSRRNEDGQHRDHAHHRHTGRSALLQDQSQHHGHDRKRSRWLVSHLRQVPGEVGQKNKERAGGLGRLPFPHRHITGETKMTTLTLDIIAMGTIICGPMLLGALWCITTWMDSRPRRRARR